MWQGRKVRMTDKETLVAGEGGGKGGGKGGGEGGGGEVVAVHQQIR